MHNLSTIIEQIKAQPTDVGSFVTFLFCLRGQVMGLELSQDGREKIAAVFDQMKGREADILDAITAPVEFPPEV